MLLIFGIIALMIVALDFCAAVSLIFVDDCCVHPLIIVASHFRVLVIDFTSHHQAVLVIDTPLL